jgi:hypothetical protein
MTDFFDKLEFQRRVELQKVLIGAELGILAVTAIIRLAVDPSSVLDYVPALGAAIPGACIAAGVIERSDS